ncbi:MAG: 23S rRNA (adenine(2503)-C(2))-methyltransferase RlmN [Candidatus Magasanikbacteria bacterium]|nr:23S rRNA (adenine(2503)-C(2))-methyltransferase RlmN [Candidatus Magasanikbacteria bacterium]
MNFDKIKIILKDEPKFRFKQVFKAIFVDLIFDWNQNTTLPLYLRETLNKECPINIEAEVLGSKNSESLKALITLGGGSKIETVLLKHKDGRATVCVSSQVGCPMRCDFCATGKMGFKRNLETGEIIEQVLFWQRYLNNSNVGPKRLTNVVYMGMGEPFLNYDNVMESAKIINDKDGINIGARHISISTCGLVPGIKKFAKEKMQINLAVSLHAPNDKLRSELMPVNTKYPIKELMSEVKNYVNARSRQVMFEYLMIDGVNDSEYHAKELAKLMDNPLYVVNLIRYNQTGKFYPSSATAIKKFTNILMRNKIKVIQRYSFGSDINAACGQLAGINEKER